MCEGWDFQGCVKLTLRLSVQLQSRQPYESDLHAGVKPLENITELTRAGESQLSTVDPLDPEDGGGGPALGCGEACSGYHRQALTTVHCR